MTQLRRIKPISFPDVTPSAVAGARPELRWVAPTDLYVDETYQRDLGRKSLVLIEQMYKDFAWNRMKPPIVVDADGKLHVIDGQHTAIAAASIGLPEIPIFVVEAGNLDERARAFVGHNTDRITVHPIAIYNALRAAGDPDALDVERVCARAGVRIRDFNLTSTIAEGDTKAIGLIRHLIKRRGVIKARKVLECLVKSQMKPISGGAISAAENFVCVERPEVDLEILARVIRMDGEAGASKARAKAAAERIPFWRALMLSWLRRLDQEAPAA
jgi:hypothetical protein